MEYRELSEEKRKLFRDSAFTGVPPFVTAKGELQSLSDAGNSFVEFSLGVTKEEYLAYKQALMEDGWKEGTHHPEPIQKIVNTSVFEKEGRLVILSCYDFPEGHWLPPKFYRTVALVPSYRHFDAGDLFRDVPVPEEIPARDTGEGHFTKTVEEADPETFEAFRGKLAEADWKEVNESSVAGVMFTALYEKGARRLSALLAKPTGKLYVTVGETLDPVSPHLKDLPEWKSGFLPEAKTSLSMLELWHFGNSFVIRLKNGHFLVSDGGLRCETPYLIEYLESLAPAGEKPVVEGWFISHLHADHAGVLNELALNETWGERIRVDGIYMSAPSLEMLALEPAGAGVLDLVRMCSDTVKTAAGESVPFYRLRTGERLYFADVTVDTLMSQELLPYEDCTGDLNDTSSWLLFTIEGQKVLIAGDGDKGGMLLLMANYPPEFMSMDIMGLLHHGWNTRDFFTDYCRTKTMLFTCFEDGPERKEKENAYQKTKVEEWFPWSQGTRVLTFPYHVGESECLPHFVWKYHEGEERPHTPNVKTEKR